MSLLNVEQPSKTIIPTKKDLQAMLTQDTDWSPLNPVMVVEDLVKVADFKKGYFFTRKLAANINGDYFDIPVQHYKSEKSLDRFYNIPLISCKSAAPEDIFRLAFEVLCHHGKRRIFARHQDMSVPCLIDANFDGISVTHKFSPYIRTNVYRIFQENSATGERFKSMIVDVLAEESSYAR